MGSHIVGMYGRAASELEKELHSYVKEYVDPGVNAKATLGVLAKILDDSSDERDRRLASLANAANDPWVDIKHKYGPDASEIEVGLSAIADAYQLLLDSPSSAGQSGG